MSSPTNRVKGLLRDIKQDTQHYDALKTLLQSQREAMIACDATRAEDINRQLLEIYQQLHGSALRRVEILTSLNLPTNSEGIKALLPHLPANVAQHAESWWKSLEASAFFCQQMNERNGNLLAMQQESLSQLTSGFSTDYIYQR